MPRHAPSLVLLLALCFGVAALGGLSTASNVETWYPTLVRPTWRPPNGLFAPVWTVLYLSMAVAMWDVWRRTGWPEARTPVIAFGTQLALNAAWSPLFFGAHALGAALIDIVLMACAILWTIVAFWPHSRLSAGLMVPYLLWVSFATALNAWIWWMN